MNTFYYDDASGKKELLLKWADGNPLSNKVMLTIPSFIAVAREIVSCLNALDFNGTSHLKLTYDHIIFNSEINSIKIIGFDSSSLFCNKRSHNQKLLQRDLHHISLE